MKLEVCGGVNITNNEIKYNKLYLSFYAHPDNKYILHFDSNYSLKITINFCKYDFVTSGKYLLLLNNENTENFELEIERINNNTIDDTTINTMYIYKYGDPISVYNETYQIFYSFDKNYFSGAFASIYSLYLNFDKFKLQNLRINLIIPEENFNDLQKLLIHFQEKINPFKIKFSIYLINKLILDENIMGTKCYKGGGHLLKLSNYSRLIIGHLIKSSQVLYVDSDTIIQSDLSKCLDKVINEKYMILGKKSDLNYKNIFNSNNLHYADDYLGKKFDINRNIIFTGTLIINAIKMNRQFNKLTELVKLHNSLENKGGLYKLFTMSLINISFHDQIGYMDEYINNVVDLGFRKDLDGIIQKADVLDWSGVYKPWFINGMYKEYWMKYNIVRQKSILMKQDKNTIENF